jgi:DNA-binding response OmpR family regulator
MSPTRILVVEDDRDSREALAQVLRTDGHTVFEACDALEGTSTLRAMLLAGQLPHIIVADIFMPGASGLTFVAGVRVLGVTSPVIVITAWPTHDFRMQVQRLDAELVAKPLDPSALCQRVRDLLDAPLR